MKENHDINELDLESPNKNFFTNNFMMDVFMFKIAIISIITTMIILYVLFKHNKLRTLVVSLALQQVKEVSASATKQENKNMCNCTPQFYIILALSITIIGLVIFTICYLCFPKVTLHLNIYGSLLGVVFGPTVVIYMILPLNMCMQMVQNVCI